MPEIPVDHFPALSALPGVRHGFSGRVQGLDVGVDREAALARLQEHLEKLRARLGLGGRVFVTAQQVHGREVAVVDRHSALPVPAVDGLITSDPGVCLGIYVADCGPVYLVDPVRRVIALLHSGRRGTELGIVGVAVEMMVRQFGSDPTQMVAQLGPCIRPPHYEVDFAAEILGQCRAAGVGQVHDCGSCTGALEERYYSYRREKGRTGRMLALLGLE